MVETLGKYEILSILGRGAFATVHLARDTILHREVALKILHPPLLTDPEFVRRFENDARAAAQLDHPHIVTIHDLGQAEGRLFIAMQYLPGGSLAEQLSNQGPLPFSDAVVLITQVAGALGYAHDRGFIHRDVKPSNVLLNARGEPVLADFGLVSAAESSIVARSSAGGTVGTPAYIAPELWDNQPATPATDVYALACVLYEALMGEALFRGDTSPAVMRAHFRPPCFPETWPEGTPPEIGELLARALAPDPDQRTPTPGGFAAKLHDLTELAADPLAAPYAALQAALAAEDWPQALQLAAEIRAQDPDYRDVTALAQEAAEAQARQERRQWATQWKTQALAAEEAGEYQAARTAARKWLEMAPQSADAQALLDRIDARLQAVEGEMDEAPPTIPVTRRVGLPRLPMWAWSAIALALLALLVGLGTLLNFPIARQTTLKTTTTDLVSGMTRVRETDGMTMVYVPAGEFEMGSTTGDGDEEPIHTVKLNALWLDQTEVTNAQYQACVNSEVCEEPWYSDVSSFNAAEQPVVGVSWYDAEDYCIWVGGRLPTEAEWEYAARGPESTLYPWGNTWQVGLANCDETDCQDGYEHTAPVGSFPGGASWVGALDMAGNVWEWVADWYASDYYEHSPQENPRGPSSGDYRVLRGGSWYFIGKDVRGADRYRYNPASSYDYNGFRCAVDATPGE